jgi:hypothetical protein
LTQLSQILSLPILLAHGIIEEAVQKFIEESMVEPKYLPERKSFAKTAKLARAIYPYPETFWNVIKKFNDLGNAAAHRNWEQEKTACMKNLRDAVL